VPENPETTQTYLLIGVAIIAVLLMGGAIILFVLYYQKRMAEEKLQRHQMELQFQKKMIEAALESQENERRRVAADLHDSIGAMLSTIRLSLTTHVKQNKQDLESIAESKRMLDDTIDSIRRISRDLMPSTLEKFGLPLAVREMCDRFQSTASVPISFEEIGTTPHLSKTRELMIFRIIQELLNNAIKHSGASCLKVLLRNSDHLDVIVEDDGTGFDLDEQQKMGQGLGLFTIENRARLAGGAVIFNSEPGKGSKTIISVPYEKV
jgi:two-component system NarL family sensor kinase